MKKIWKKTIGIVLLLLPVFLCTTVSAAEPAVQIYDEAELFSAEETKKLNEQIAQLEKMVSWDITILTCQDTGEDSDSDYVKAWREDHDPGENGAVLLVKAQERTVSIHTFGETSYYVTKDRKEEHLKNLKETLEAGAFYNVCTAALEDISKDYQRGIPDEAADSDGANTEGIETDPSSRKITAGEGMTAFLLAVLSGTAVLLTIAGREKKKPDPYVFSYRENSSLTLTRQEDNLTAQSVTHRHITRPSQNKTRG